MFRVEFTFYMLYVSETRYPLLCGLDFHSSCSMFLILFILYCEGFVFIFHAVCFWLSLSFIGRVGSSFYLQNVPVSLYPCEGWVFSLAAECFCLFIHMRVGLQSTCWMFLSLFIHMRIGSSICRLNVSVSLYLYEGWVFSLPAECFCLSLSIWGLGLQSTCGMFLSLFIHMRVGLQSTCWMFLSLFFHMRVGLQSTCWTLAVSVYPYDCWVFRLPADCFYLSLSIWGWVFSKPAECFCLPLSIWGCMGLQSTIWMFMSLFFLMRVGSSFYLLYVPVSHYPCDGWVRHKPPTT